MTTADKLYDHHTLCTIIADLNYTQASIFREQAAVLLSRADALEHEAILAWANHEQRSMINDQSHERLTQCSSTDSSASSSA